MISLYLRIKNSIYSCYNLKIIAKYENILNNDYINVHNIKFFVIKTWVD